MSDRFRIHGDNIVECERIAKLILKEIEPAYVTIALMSPSTIVYRARFEYCGRRYDWQLELLPGYNKAGRRRWESDIFTGLKEGGSFLDETPDAFALKRINPFTQVLDKNSKSSGLRSLLN